MRDPEPISPAKLKGADISPCPPRILIIEDELLIALMITEMLRDLGYRVSGVAHTIPMATRKFARRNSAAVFLDRNTGGKSHARPEDSLGKSGPPFVFVRGSDYPVAPRHENVPILQKPFTSAHLRALLE